MMTTRRRVIRTPRDYYRRVHETRYRNILGSGAVFRQRAMQPFIAAEWAHFVTETELQPGALGVEFGSGTGINAVTIARDGYRIVGLDISPTATENAVRLAAEWRVSATFVVGDLFRLPFDDETVDFARNIRELHGVGEPERRRVHLSECHRVLRHGGTAFFHNESSASDALDADEELVVLESDEWNIAERSNRFDTTDGGTVEVTFPGFMPEGLTGRRSLSEHCAELESAGFRVLRLEAHELRPAPEIPPNRVMTAFIRKS